DGAVGEADLGDPEHVAPAENVVTTGLVAAHDEADLALLALLVDVVEADLAAVRGERPRPGDQQHRGGDAVNRADHHSPSFQVLMLKLVSISPPPVDDSVPSPARSSMKYSGPMRGLSRTLSSRPSMRISSTSCPASCLTTRSGRSGSCCSWAPAGAMHSALAEARSMRIERFMAIYPGPGKGRPGDDACMLCDARRRRRQ